MGRKENIPEGGAIPSFQNSLFQAPFWVWDTEQYTKQMKSLPP